MLTSDDSVRPKSLAAVLSIFAGNLLVGSLGDMEDGYYQPLYHFLATFNLKPLFKVSKTDTCIIYRCRNTLTQIR